MTTKMIDLEMAMHVLTYDFALNPASVHAAVRQMFPEGQRVPWGVFANAPTALGVSKDDFRERYDRREGAQRKAEAAANRMVPLQDVIGLLQRSGNCRAIEAVTRAYPEPKIPIRFSVSKVDQGYTVSMTPLDASRLADAASGTVAVLKACTKGEPGDMASEAIDVFEALQAELRKAIGL